jgi:hypothetical protein
LKGDRHPSDLGPFLTLEKFAMKKTLIALAALAAASTAFAQSTATISGSINTGFQKTGKAGDSAAIASMGGGANAIDINTVEDLGGGMKAGFSGQIRFNAASGDVGSSGLSNTTSLFHAANAYVSGGFGTIRAGKIAEASNCGYDAWGCIGGAGFGAGVGTSTLAGAAAVANAVSYTTPTINGFSASAMSSQAATGRTNERQSFTLAYANGPVGLQYLQTNNSGNTTSTTTAITDVKAKQASIGASYNFGIAKLNVLNVKEEDATGATTKDVTGVNASVPMGAYTFLAGYAKDKKAVANADTKIAAGVSYALSKRTTVGADVFKAEQGANTGTGFIARVRHTF